jgi:hypothetical protein
MAARQSTVIRAKNHISPQHDHSKDIKQNHIGDVESNSSLSIILDSECDLCDTHMSGNA